MKPLVLLGLASMACFPASAQVPDAGWAVEGPVDLFETDALGNLYTLRGHDLDLYGRDGAHVAHNSFSAFGRISRIDAFSSMKPMIFSRDMGQLALLDNTLSIQGSTMDLPRHGFTQATLACTGVQGRFWFFDERDMALVRVDVNLRQAAHSGRLDQLLSFTPQPTYMEEADNRLYLVDPAHGVLVFDLFGTFMRTLPIHGAHRVQVRDGSVWYVADGLLQRYDLLAFTTETVPWPPAADPSEVLEARIGHGRLYLRSAHGIQVLPIGE